MPTSNPTLARASAVPAAAADAALLAVPVLGDAAGDTLSDLPGLDDAAGGTIGEARSSGAFRGKRRETFETALGGEAGRSLDQLSALLAESELSAHEQRILLIHGWEAAVEEVLEDRMLSIDEEGSLLRYAKHFGLEQDDLEDGGGYSNLMKAAVLREVAEGVVPKRMQFEGRLPFNLMKSEELVWVIDDVEYLETRVRRIRQGTSHGLSIRVARGLYYRPGVFRSEAIEREETNHVDTGTLGFTTKHVYFHGTRKRFRVRYDKVVSFDPYSDGFGLMRDAQTAKPQTFITGDGWFAYNLVVNLAQL